MNGACFSRKLYWYFFATELIILCNKEIYCPLIWSLMDFELLECFQFYLYTFFFMSFLHAMLYDKKIIIILIIHDLQSFPYILFFLHKTEFLLLLLLCLPDWSLALSWGSSFSLLPALQKSWSWQHEITKCDSFFRHHTGFSGGKLYSVGRHLFICKIIIFFK